MNDEQLMLDAGNDRNANEDVNAARRTADKRVLCVLSLGTLLGVLLTSLLVSLFFWAGRHALWKTPNVEIAGCVVRLFLFVFVVVVVDVRCLCLGIWNFWI